MSIVPDQELYRKFSLLVGSAPIPSFTPPLELFHYTDTAGLYGIISEGQLRATHASCLNDYSEVQHGINVAMSQLNEIRSMPWNPRPIQVLDTALSFIAMETASAHLTTHIFIASFSELNNDLSQWRSYAANGHGYCIGFNTSALLGRVNKMSEPDLRVLPWLLRVEYDVQRQKTIAKERACTILHNFLHFLTKL